LFGVSEVALRQALREFDPPGQRASIVALPGGAMLINDSYNSNPKAMRMMLETLRDWPARGRRIVVAGEMLELGPASPELHREVGAICVANRVDWLIAVRGDARFILEGARCAGFLPQRLSYFDRPEDAVQFCRGLLRSGDVILVKGSRGVHLEDLIKPLQAGLETHDDEGARAGQ
jgi:UDP-N-acetylmuramoyl-tripeptide--D-alanyl-D-alanine ligase